MPVADTAEKRGTPIERAMGLLVQHPQLGKIVPVNNALETLKMEGAKIFVALHRQTYSNELNTAQLLEGWRGTRYEEGLRNLAQWNHQILDEHLEQEFKDTYMFLIDRYLEQRYEELRALPSEQLTNERLREIDQIIRALKNTPS